MLSNIPWKKYGGTGCDDCGSDALTFDYSHQGASGIQDGRHKTNEIQTTIFLGCNSCSHTQFTISLDEFLGHMNLEIKG